jgi:hypothetical protein
MQEHGEVSDFFSFVTSVSKLLEEAAGIRYAEVSRSIHPQGHAPRHAFEGGVAPADFVAGMIADEGLVCVSDAEDARGYNLAKAAVAEFAHQTPGWHRSSDGVYHKPQDEVTLTIRPLLDRESGRYGFGVEVRDGTIEPGGDSSGLGDVQSRHAGFDISAPVEEAAEFVQSARDFRR